MKYLIYFSLMSFLIISFVFAHHNALYVHEKVQSDSTSLIIEFYNFNTSKTEILNQKKINNLVYELNMTAVCSKNSNFIFQFGASAFLPEKIIIDKFGSSTTFWLYNMTQLRF